MGNDQSRENGGAVGGNLPPPSGNTSNHQHPQRVHKQASTGGAVVSATPPERSASPRPSICSDADLPYISYTVNRPIGESPKHSTRPKNLLRRSSSRQRRVSQSRQRPSEIVVVKEAPSNTSVDADLAKLQAIPTFLPIMRGALTAPATRDPEVLERINPVHLANLARRYQAHLFAAATATATQQDDITQSVKQVDAAAATLVSVLTERQRTYAKHAERLSHVSEVSHSLANCHSNLNNLLETVETLNNMLPIGDRLEPFVWTTG